MSETVVGYATYGHSHYDDELWAWLNNNRQYLGPDDALMPDLLDVFDFIGAWGWLLRAGCTIVPSGEDPDWTGEGGRDAFTITYPGTATQLVAVLDALFNGKMEWQHA